MDRAVAPLAMAGLDHDDPQAQQGETYCREGDVEVGEHGPPLSSRLTCLMAGPPATHSCTDTVGARPASRARGPRAGGSAEYGRLKLEQGERLVGRTPDIAMTTTDSCNQPTHHAARDQQPNPERDLLDRQTQELDRSGRRSHLQRIGQLADLGRRVAA